MSKTTPGEWIAGVATVNWELFISVGVEGTKKATAICGDVGADDEKESWANAHLIAAAPDMLELLESLHNQSTIAEGIRIAAVIAKAKGGQA